VGLDTVVDTSMKTVPEFVAGENMVKDEDVTLVTLVPTTTVSPERRVDPTETPVVPKEAPVVLETADTVFDPFVVVPFTIVTVVTVRYVGVRVGLTVGALVGAALGLGVGEPLT